MSMSILIIFFLKKVEKNILNGKEFSLNKYILNKKIADIIERIVFKKDFKKFFGIETFKMGNKLLLCIVLETAKHLIFE